MRELASIEGQLAGIIEQSIYLHMRSQRRIWCSSTCRISRTCSTSAPTTGSTNLWRRARSPLDRCSQPSRQLLLLSICAPAGAGLVVGCNRTAIACGAASFTVPPHTIRMSSPVGCDALLARSRGNLSWHEGERGPRALRLEGRFRVASGGPPPSAALAGPLSGTAARRCADS